MKRFIGLAGIVLMLGCGNVNDSFTYAQDGGYDAPSFPNEGNSENCMAVNNRRPIVEILSDGLLDTEISGFNRELHIKKEMEHAFDLRAIDPDQNNFWINMAYGDKNNAAYSNINDSDVLKLEDGWHSKIYKHSFKENGNYDLIGFAIDEFSCIGYFNVKVFVE